jgi:hypothetical protein
LKSEQVLNLKHFKTIEHNMKNRKTDKNSFNWEETKKAYKIKTPEKSPKNHSCVVGSDLLQREVYWIWRRHKSVMTMATREAMGQVMTWIGCGTGFGLLEWFRSFVKKPTAPKTAEPPMLVFEPTLSVL